MNRGKKKSMFSSMLHRILKEMPTAVLHRIPFIYFTSEYMEMQSKSSLSLLNDTLARRLVGCLCFLAFYCFCYLALILRRTARLATVVRWDRGSPLNKLMVAASLAALSGSTLSRTWLQPAVTTVGVSTKCSWNDAQQILFPLPVTFVSTSPSVLEQAAG